MREELAWHVLVSQGTIIAVYGRALRSAAEAEARCIAGLTGIWPRVEMVVGPRPSVGQAFREEDGGE